MPPSVPIRLAVVHDAVPIAQMSRDLIEQGLGWSWMPPRVRHEDYIRQPVPAEIIIPAVY